MASASKDEITVTYNRDQLRTLHGALQEYHNLQERRMKGQRNEKIASIIRDELNQVRELQKMTGGY